MLKRNAICALVGLAMAWVGSAAYGQLSAAVTISAQQLSANSYDYSVSMKNTSATTSIDALWYAWLPGYDLLTTVPTSISSPAGWGDTVEQEAFNGSSASILWQNATTPLAPGQTLSGFNFITSDPPSVVQGSSTVFGLPTEYAYIYNGVAAASGVGGSLVIAQTVAAPLPEPTSLALVAGPMAWMMRRKRKACRA
jgi:hypothetical protein